MNRVLRSAGKAAAAAAFLLTVAASQPGRAAETGATAIVAAETSAVTERPDLDLDLDDLKDPVPAVAVPAVIVPVVTLPADRSRPLEELVREHAGTEARDEQARCLANAIYFESNGEPLAGQLAVAEVIINRARSGRFASTLCGVITQRSQFSFVRGGRIPQAPRTSAGWRNAVAIAHIAIDDLADSPVSTALFFHARRVSPGWRLRRLASVGNHVFYR